MPNKEKKYVIKRTKFIKNNKKNLVITEIDTEEENIYFESKDAARDYLHGLAANIDKETKYLVHENEKYYVFNKRMKNLSKALTCFERETNIKPNELVEKFKKIEFEVICINGIEKFDILN